VLEDEKNRFAIVTIQRNRAQGARHKA